MITDPRPSPPAPFEDLFLRRLAWWICGAVLYLQLLSILRLLGSTILTSLPLAFGIVWLAWRWRGARSLVYSRPLSLALVAVIIASAIFFFSHAMQPPRGFDVLAYHLPYIVEWMRNGWAVPFYSAFSGPVGYYPGNLELLALPFLSLTSSAYLLNAINVFSFALILGVIWPLAKKINLNAPLAVFVFAVLMFTAEGTRRNLGNAYNDLFLTALLIAAWYFVEEYFEKHRMSDLWLSGLMAGMAVGTRYAGIYYAGALVLYFAIRTRRVGSTIMLFAAILIPSAYWYARNWMITGNPVYPQELSLFGTQLLSGINWANANQLLLFQIADAQFLRLLLISLFRNGHVLLLPLLAIFPMRKFFRRELRSFWIAGLVCFGIYLVTPLSAEDFRHVYLNFRYAMPFQWLVMMAGGLAVLAAFPMRRVVEWLESHTVRVSYSALAAALLIIIIAGYPVYQKSYVKWLPQLNPKPGASWVFIETLPSSRIAYAGWDLAGGLYGSHFQHDVQYININQQSGSNYHEYPGGDHRSNQDFDAWRTNLDAARIDVLWIFKHTPTIEREWVSSHAQLFPTIYEDESVRIVRVEGTGSDETFNTAFYQ